MEQQSISPQSGADILRPLFICKLVRNGVNADDLLEEYKLALKGMPRGAVIRVVDKIRNGVLCNSNNFCPLPPELASLVREEWRMQRLLEAPNALPAPVRANVALSASNQWQGRRLLVENINLDQFRSMARKQEVPVGAIFVAILGNVYAGAQ